MPFLRVVFILILGCLVACGSTDELTRPGSPATDPLSPPPPPPPPPGSAGAVSIRLESAPALPTFVGQRVWIHVLAFDANRG
jgi:hypothetical protein